MIEATCAHAGARTEAIKWRRSPDRWALDLSGMLCKILMSAKKIKAVTGGYRSICTVALERTCSEGYRGVFMVSRSEK